jgi:hypothetical protein
MSIEDELCDGFEDVTWLLWSNIYILCLGREPQYVGRSNNLLVRLFKHRSAGRIAFNRVLVKTVPRDQASAEETRLIHSLQPPFNIASTPRAKRLTQAEVSTQARRLRHLVRGGIERRI